MEEREATMTSIPVVPGVAATAGLRKNATGVASIAAVAAVVGLLLAANSGGSVMKPVGHRVYEIGITVVALGVLIVVVRQSVRDRKLRRPLLMAGAACMMFWQETYGDWGAYVLYSDKFLTYGWGNTPLSVPVRCWWFIPGYLVFYSSFFVAVIAAADVARRRWPNTNPCVAAALLCFPAFYAFDLVWEGITTGLGYWTYLYTFGPALHVGNGTFPLLWPILEQVPFMILAAFALTWRNSKDEDVFETIARSVIRRAPGQVATLVSWIVVTNVGFFLVTILPLIALRAIAGPDIPVIMP